LKDVLSPTMIDFNYHSLEKEYSDKVDHK